MALLLLVLPLLVPGFQDSDGELRFTRVHLRNGNVIDGQLIKDSTNEILLRLKVGEMTIRRDQIEKIEQVKMKSANDAAIYRADPNKKPAPATTPANDPKGKTVDVHTPEPIRKKVDLILFKFKNTPGGDDKEIPTAEIAALGEEAVVYLASRVPAFDLKTQDAMGIALITLKPTPKVLEILETYLSHESPSARAVAANVLCVTGGEGAKARYLRPLLRDPDPRVRVMALSMLGTTTERDWFEPLIDLSTDKDKDVRSRAIRLAQNVAEKNGLMDKLATTMISNLTSGEAGVRIDAINVIGALGKQENWFHLTKPLNDSDAAVRAAAAQAILILASPESAEEILSTLPREQDRATRLILAAAVMKLKLNKAIEPLIRWLSDPDAEVKKAAEATLAHLTGENLGPDPDKWTAWWEKNKSK